MSENALNSCHSCQGGDLPSHCLSVGHLPSPCLSFPISEVRKNLPALPSDRVAVTVTEKTEVKHLVNSKSSVSTASVTVTVVPHMSTSSQTYISPSPRQSLTSCNRHPPACPTKGLRSQEEGPVGHNSMHTTHILQSSQCHHGGSHQRTQRGQSYPTADTVMFKVTHTALSTL